MNAVLLVAATLTLALVHGNDQPCQRNYDNNAFLKFVHKHIIQESFDKTQPLNWELYLMKYGLCSRPVQTFLENWDLAMVMSLCNGFGRPVLYGSPGNLCISPAHMPVYHLTVDNNCRVTSLNHVSTYVIVACDVVINQCLPVHYERYNGQMPDMLARPCQP